jgi:hypothetical protein
VGKPSRLLILLCYEDPSVFVKKKATNLRLPIHQLSSLRNLQINSTLLDTNSKSAVARTSLDLFETTPVEFFAKAGIVERLHTAVLTK